MTALATPLQQPDLRTVVPALVLRRWKMVYVVTPKAACTNLLWMLARLQEEPLAGVRTSRSGEVTRALAIHDPTVWHSTPRLHELSPSERADVLHDPEWLVWCVTRDPLSRLWSAWQSKLLLREPAYVARYGNEPWFPDIPRHPRDVAVAFADFVDALGADPSLLAADIHWRPQHELLRPDVIPYSHIGRVEELEATLTAVEGHLRALGRTEPLVSERHNQGLLPLSTAGLSATRRRVVERLYAGDFEHFGRRRDTRSATTRTSPTEVELHAVVAVIERNERIGDLLRSGRADSPARTRRSKGITLLVTGGAPSAPDPRSGVVEVVSTRTSSRPRDDVEDRPLFPERSGPAAAQIHAASARARGDVIVICDTPEHLPVDWLDAALEALDDPAVGMVGAPAEVAPGELVGGARLIDDALNRQPFPIARPGTVPVPVLTGAPLAIRAEVLRSVGGWDAGYHGGDHAVDLSLRLWRAGYACAVTGLPAAPLRNPVADPSTSSAERYLDVVDRLRLGAIHLDPTARRALLQSFGDDPLLAPALTEVVRSDAGARRALLDRSAARPISSYFATWSRGA
jgi:hypothetical protein